VALKEEYDRFYQKKKIILRNGVLIGAVVADDRLKAN
jgi:hypothetical protein